jgi:hypothetical protein
VLDNLSFEIIFLDVLSDEGRIMRRLGVGQSESWSGGGGVPLIG